MTTFNSPDLIPAAPSPEAEPWDLAIHIEYLLQGYGVRGFVALINDCFRISANGLYLKVLDAPEFPVEGDPNQIATDDFLDGALVSQLLNQDGFDRVLAEMQRIVAFRCGGVPVNLTTLSLL